MSRAELNRIREAISGGRYYLTDHANEKMLEEDLDIVDIEASILTGILKRKNTHHPRGTVYTIHGTATDPVTPVGTAGRFTGSGQYRVITVYRVTARRKAR